MYGGMGTYHETRRGTMEVEKGLRMKRQDEENRIQAT